MPDAGTGSATSAPTEASRVEIDYEAVLSGPVLWLLLIAAVLGLVGGIARIFKVGYTTPPPSHRHQFVGGAFIGAVSAISAFYVLSPGSPLKFVSACLIAGYAGPALMDAFEARFKVLVAEAKAVQATEIGKKAVGAARRALDAASQPGPARAASADGPPPEDPFAGLRFEIESLAVQVNALEAGK